MVIHIKKLPLFVTAKRQEKPYLVQVIRQMVRTTVFFGTDYISRRIDRDNKYDLPIWMYNLICLYFMVQVIIGLVQKYTNDPRTHQLYKEMGEAWILKLTITIDAIASLIAQLLLLYTSWVVVTDNMSRFNMAITIGICVNVLFLLIVALQIDPVRLTNTIIQENETRKMV